MKNALRKMYTQKTGHANSGSSRLQYFVVVRQEIIKVCGGRASEVALVVPMKSGVGVSAAASES